MTQLTQEQFFKDVKNHQMNIISDDGTSRHLRFQEPGTYNCRFDLITWAGHLCVTGDCGTYVFSRIHDMFEFFRGDRINTGYWEEKCISIDRHGETEKYSPDRFRQCVLNDFWSATEDMDRPKRRELWEAIKEEVICAADDGEIRAFDAATEFSFEGFQFHDFWEHDCKEYSHRFVWNLYAIIYGISQYDQKLAAAS